MVVAQKVKEAEITEQDSLLLTRNLLRIAIFNISYIRGLFPEKYFNDKSVPALDMKIKKLMPMDAESRRLIDWMEKGVYDALQKKYLKTLLFCICESAEGPMIEEYAFSFSYPSVETDEVSMNITRNKRQGGTFKSKTMEITPSQMRSSACKMIRTLVQLMKTLDCMPDERTILMKLLYYDDITPPDYEPPFFRSCSEQEANVTWMKNPLKMEVGNVKSVLDPCEDENEDMEDDVSLGEDSAQEDDSDSSYSEKQHAQEDQYIMMPIGKNRSLENNGGASEDDTQDPEQDEGNLVSVREWIASRHTDTVDIADILSNFHDISVVLIEEIVEKLIKEGLLIVVGKDTYKINRTKKPDCEMADVKEEVDLAEPVQGEKTSKDGEEDHMYMKALYHALPLEYVTVTKLQRKLKGSTSLYTVRKLIDKMTFEGFLEVKSNGKLGKRVIRSEASSRKLEEVKRALEMELETNGNTVAKYNLMAPSSGSKENDESICGALRSIGSDITRTLGKYTTNSGQTPCAKSKSPGNTPLSKAQPIASRESVAPVANAQGIAAQNTTNGSRSTQEKHFKRASMVKDPIPQLVKRLKAHAAS